jgi:multidrug transporter EmrE-like cation transporter
MDLILIFWVLFGALVSAIPVTLIKLYTETKQKFLLFISVICYLLVLVSYVNVFEKGNMITFYIIMKVLSDTLVILSGILFFSDKLTIKTSFGILFAFLSVYLLSS